MELCKLRRSLILCTTGLLIVLLSTRLFAAEATHDDTHAPAATAGQHPAVRVKPERLWLPSSAQHLRPYLELAVERSLEDEDCHEILYARLNEYRTVYDEPTFSVLCKKDYKTTYNHIYPVSELDEFYDSRVEQSETIATSASALGEDIQALRESLLVPSDAIVNNSLPAAVREATAATPSGDTRSSNQNQRDEDPNDLSLDLTLDLDF